MACLNPNLPIWVQILRRLSWTLAVMHGKLFCIVNRWCTVHVIFISNIISQNNVGVDSTYKIFVGVVCSLQFSESNAQYFFIKTQNSCVACNCWWSDYAVSRYLQVGSKWRKFIFLCIKRNRYKIMILNNRYFD